MAKRKNKLLLSDLFPELAFSELAFSELAFSELAFEGIPDGIHILDE
jgi:hypothetical protein